MKKVNTNWSKYRNTIGWNTAKQTGELAPERDPEKVEQANKVKEVCLNCKKKKCTGDWKCYRKERDRINDKG